MQRDEWFSKKPLTGPAKKTRASLWRRAAPWLSALLIMWLAGMANASYAVADRLEPLPKPLYPRVAVQRDVPIVMNDGAQLYADVYRPADKDGHAVAGQFPSVLTLLPYVKRLQKTLKDVDAVLPLPAGAGIVAMGNDFVRRGFVYVVVDVRGTGASEGEWMAWDAREQADYLDISRWLTAQPFSNGEFGLFGISYLAIAALLAAEQQPPGLKAVFAVSAAEDVYRDLFRGGDVPYLVVGGLIGIIKAAGFLPPGYADTDPEAARKLREARLSALAWPKEVSRQIREGGEFGFDSDFFRLRSPGSRINRINVPTFLVGGWFDLYQRGMPRLYQQLQLPPGQKQLLMGPWYHLTIGAGLGRSDTPPKVDTLAQLWFERWLKQADNGIDRFGPVTRYSLGAKRWRTTQAALDENLQWQRYYLGPQHSMSLTPAASDGHDERRAHLNNGWCTRSTTQWTAGGVRLGPCETDNRLMEKSALTYTTEVLDRDLHIAGPLALTLHAATTGADANWIATVSDVAPSGKSTQITSGALVASQRTLDAARSEYNAAGELIVPYHPFTMASLSPVPPGELVQLDIEIFNVDAVLQAGHRLRLTLSSSDQPTLGPPLAQREQRKGTVRVHYGPAQPSSLLVPVVP